MKTTVVNVPDSIEELKVTYPGESLETQSETNSSENIDLKSGALLYVAKLNSWFYLDEKNTENIEKNILLKK